MKKFITYFAVSVFVWSLWSIGCGSSSVDGISGPGGAGGSGAGGSSMGTGGGYATCTLKLVGDACSSDGECCTGNCDPGAKLCSQRTGACKAPASACVTAQDCCTRVCSNGTCGATQCTSDNQACTSSDQCCSGTCGASGSCTPITTICRTSGNSCTNHSECCSKACLNGTCSAGGSFCTQTNDACASDVDCCGGICTRAQGSALGSCTTPQPPGVPGCQLAGEACAAAAGDGGTGVPSCGGSCCSRACAPYKGGVPVCQPPSGCRPTGEICRSDADCCGFGGIQGQTGVGNCSKTNATDPVGRCDNGNACRPAGAICKLATMSCNAENNCCAGNVNQNPYVCQQDILGIPRCTMKGESCTDGGSKTGQACATSADCCGLACVPNPSFTTGASMPAFVCGGTCVGTGGTCSTGADCCPGLPCIMTPGSSRGTCGGQPPSDAGIVTPPDATVPDSGVPPSCAEYGQVCASTTDCCNGVPCVGGHCIIIVN